MENCASDPLDVIFRKYILVFLGAAGIHLMARSGHVAAQQGIFPVLDQSLAGPAVGVGGEVVSEEPGAESHGGIFHQGGVHQLRSAGFRGQ